MLEMHQMPWNPKGQRCTNNPTERVCNKTFLFQSGAVPVYADTDRYGLLT